MDSILNLSISDEKINILQITDTHLFADKEEKLLGIPTFKTFHAVINKILALGKKYHLIVCSGDISQDQTELSYTHFMQEIEKLETPLVWIPGNHDEQSLMQKLLTNKTIFQSKTIVVNNNWQLVLLDSQFKGYPKGMLNDKQLDFLDNTLHESKDKNTLIFIHHNPKECGSAWLDEHKLQNSDALAKILEKHEGIKAVICGHIHQEINSSWLSWPFYSTPSTSIQFLPQSDQFSLDVNYPGFREFELNLNGSFSTKVTRIETPFYQIDKEAKGY
ncbi:3',5'-cyclic-AMP phosphodiesterase [Thorsellia kenyensis]|uniref:3',5'-cyclic-AMP phosphodiesterase n=1 Tax=Thorsellia kenyensis TaxID=1549888 RepID=A0ABV6CCF2_9GAMM